ncbi:flagellar biosynthesis, cell-distal portion of basal-body rod [Klebsiella pneumoniae]|nr:flagellar biosynthesis, cell-distal portion of basal-body rod [Klebsiella pneumoniae]
MAELNPPLGTTTPEIFLDNVKRADELVNGPAGTVNDRAGEPLDTWRQMMAKNDEVRQNIIPLSKQYATLAAAQADIANIPEGSTAYYRSPDDSALAIEVMNVGGTLTATGRKMPSQEYVESVDEYVTTRLFSDVLPGIPFLLQDEESGVIMFGEDSGATHVPGLSLKYGSDLAYSVTQIPGVAHVELDENGNVLRWVDDSGETHDASPGSGAEPTPVAVSSPVISPPGL